LPELISLYESYADHRDKFAIVTIHDKTISSFADLDKKLPKIGEQYWEGKQLPFPILLDPSGKTAELYRINVPAGLLIDPEGKLVGQGMPSALEEKLPPLPASKQWARYQDLTKRIAWSFEPGNHTLNNLVSMIRLGMGWGTGCPVELDTDALKASGLMTDGTLPGVLIGNGVTLRSLDRLLLEPLDLGVVPSPDEKSLRITRRRPTPTVESYLQKLHNKELAELLDRGNGHGKPLEIKNQTLLDALKRIGAEYDFPFAFDARAIRAGTLDPQWKVSGHIAPGNLRTSIARLLAPLGLTVEVRDEVVFVTSEGH
jgi:hypothetical protein